MSGYIYSDCERLNGTFMPLNSARTQSCRSDVLKRLYLWGFRLGGAGMYISNERSAEWYIRVSGIVNHLQWIFPFTRSTFRSTQCAGFFWKLLWLTHRRITDTCSHTFKGFCHSSGAWAEPEQQELDWYFLLWHPWPASALIFHGGHACMYVCVFVIP